MKTSWAGHKNGVDVDALRDRLTDQGVFDELDAVSDALERGENPFKDMADPNKLAEAFRQTRG